MPWFIGWKSKTYTTVASLADFFDIPSYCNKNALNTFTPTFSPSFYLGYNSTAGVYHKGFETFNTQQKITLRSGSESKTCTFNLYIMCALASYSCCDKKYKFCAANVQELGKIDVSKMFYAPFGCQWRTTNTWTYFADSTLGTIVTPINRSTRKVYLKVSQTKY
jgi:hypothetical protein